MSTKDIVMEYFRSNNIPVKDIGENLLAVDCEGSNLYRITELLTFTELDGEDSDMAIIGFRFMGIENSCFKGREAAALALCNNLNKTYNFLRFFVYDNSCVIAIADAFLRSENCGEYVHRLSCLFGHIVDLAYPEILKVNQSV